MGSRMDRYNSNQDNSNNSRTSKNKKLYDDLYTNTSYTQFVSGDSLHNSIYLEDDNEASDSKRERYQNSKRVSNFMSSSEKKVNSSLENSYFNISKLSALSDEKKVHDINQVLEEARKNRNDEDSLERKRKLRTTEYDILTELSSEKVKEYKDRQKNSGVEEENDEKVDTSSISVDSNENGSDLLDDLMPNPLDETIVTEPLVNTEVLDDGYDVVDDISDDNAISTDTIGQEGKEVEVLEETVLKLDESFYTKSMDLSEYDLVENLENAEFEPRFMRKSKKYIILKILIILVIIAILIGIGFVVVHYVKL